MPGRVSRRITGLFCIVWTALLGSALAWPGPADAATFTLTKIADTSTAIPGGTVSQSGQFGLYLSAGGALTTVITSDDILDGKPIFSLHASRGALSDNAIAFRAVFWDFSEGVFVATMDPMVVPIDIKPGSVPNSINLGAAGVVPVAILGSLTFDATTVDPTTVTLAGAAVALRGKGTPMASFQDVDGDGVLDLIVQVKTDALQLSDVDVEAVLTGTTYTGEPIRGIDSVRVVP